MDRATFEAELTRDGYACRESGMDANTFNDTHTHPFDARLFVTAGEITVNFEGSEKTCRPGDSFSLAANIPHTEKVGPEGVSYVAGRRES